MNRIIVTGPTASGKGALAVELARVLGGEIVSIDSMKIFRGMDVGTAKPSAALRQEIRFHLIDIRDPWEDFSVGKYLPLALEAVRDIEARGKAPILAGGTALYLNALVQGFFAGPEADWSLRSDLLRSAEREGWPALHRRLLDLDPGLLGKVHPNDHKRIIRALEVVLVSGKRLSDHWRESALRLEPGSYRLFGIEWPRDELYRRIERRVDLMFERGLIDETRRLLADPRGLSRCALKCIGYRQVIEGLQAAAPADEIRGLVQRDSRRFAKQQLTWFRRFPIAWLPPGDPAEMAREVLETRR
jgi:tRNA dimethylallyltransferase